jgi:hypothetical protein
VAADNLPPSVHEPCEGQWVTRCPNPSEDRRSSRTIPLADFVVEALSVQLAEYPREPGQSRGVSIKAVADWLGHASPVVTTSTYAHLMPADDDVARGVLDPAFAETADSSRPEEPRTARSVVAVGSRGR